MAATAATAVTPGRWDEGGETTNVGRRQQSNKASVDSAAWAFANALRHHQPEQ